ncbi:alpha/beta fold hydrolase [Psychroflexus montanilacus]|uniref:alpha/beta fold hydrolase n=1 Tax=Psychroflexus montanilacus TaxID=2873598 RepID=UPI001CCE2F18|nr:alpha/beta hydrolase [Psychroflexus montanilacus]MBZ9652999.1 alpha/beta hydrolase [Psychroflexus montanilacus]
MSELNTSSLEKSKAIKLAYNDYGDGQPIILIHGWPLNRLMWEYQVDALVSAGYRVISYDRRGFGESSKPWSGYDYDTLAKDLKDLIETLKLEDVILVGFSMGGGEVARFIGNYGTSSVDKAVLISAVTPFMLTTEDNEAVDVSVFKGMKDGISKDRPQFFKDFGKNFYNYDEFKGDKISNAFLDFTWNLAMQGSKKATLDCVDSFGKTDFREDCKKFDIPTLIVHGDADQIVPIDASAKKAVELIPNAELEIIKNAPHGLMVTHSEELNTSLLDFIKK